jgi:hypothetical protein
MAISKTQLKEAYARATGFEVSEDKTLNEYLTEQIAQYDSRVSSKKARLQAKIDALPVDGKDAMKQIALDQITKEYDEQLDIDNAGVTIN